MNNNSKIASPPEVASTVSVLNRVPTLDGLRGIAIVMVLMHNLDILDEASSRFSRIADSALDHGWIGVQLFFVLSGFLITAILIDTRDAPNYYSAFYARRVLRIFPLYYATLIVAFIIVPAFISLSQETIANQHNQTWLWFFLSNWTEPYGRGVNSFPHFWSLAVEEQFYLLWPFIVRRLNNLQLFRLCIGITIVALATRVVLLAMGQPTDAVYMLTPCRMDALAVGAGLAAASKDRIFVLSASKARFMAIGLGIVFVLGGLVTGEYSRLSPSGQTLGYLILSLACGGALLFAVRSQYSNSWYARVLTAPALRSIGKYSFAMYVLHVPINQLIGAPLRQRMIPFPNESLAISAVYIITISTLTYAAAVASYFILERPFLRLKRNFVPSTQLLSRT